MAEVYTQTPMAVIADISRVVTKVTDRITGDRSDYPLLVAMACQKRLSLYGIKSDLMFGPGAWIEILEDQTPVWTGAWGQHFHFWVLTQFGETVDLNASVSHKKHSHRTGPKPLYSPPILWSKEFPKFYRYQAEGIAELEPPSDPKFQRWIELTLTEVAKDPEKNLDKKDELDFPNEPIICSGRQLLDSSDEAFKKFDRALSISGLPTAPF